MPSCLKAGVIVKTMGLISSVVKTTDKKRQENMFESTRHIRFMA